METFLIQADVDNFFLEEVKKRSGENLNLCYQCLKCTAGCPTAPYMDYKPNNIIRMIQMGLKEKVLGSKAIWLCVSCETCGTRCPNEIDIGILMDTLREMAIKEGIKISEKNVFLLHDTFIKSIKRFGRVHEATMLMEYKFRSGDILRDMILGLGLFLKGKIPIFPSLVRNHEEIKNIFDKCKKG